MLIKTKASIVCLHVILLKNVLHLIFSKNKSIDHTYYWYDQHSKFKHSYDEEFNWLGHFIWKIIWNEAIMPRDNHKCGAWGCPMAASQCSVACILIWITQICWNYYDVKNHFSHLSVLFQPIVPVGLKQLILNWALWHTFWNLYPCYNN